MSGTARVSESAAVQALPERAAVQLAELGPALELLRSVWALNHALAVASRREFAQQGVTGPQRLVLRLVGLFPGLTPGDLARLMHVHPATLSPVISGLGQRGLLLRQADRDDGRLHRLRLTPAGQKLVLDRRGSAEDAVERALEALGGEQLAQAREVLGRLARALVAAD